MDGPPPLNPSGQRPDLGCQAYLSLSSRSQGPPLVSVLQHKPQVKQSPFRSTPGPPLQGPRGSLWALGKPLAHVGESPSRAWAQQLRKEEKAL